MESQTQDLLRNACPGPESWERLEALLEGADLPGWFEQVDESSFSLADWIEALLEFDSWLARTTVAARPVDSMVGYIHCCTMTMAETLSPPNLAAVTREMLDQHGFDATREVKSDP